MNVASTHRWRDGYDVRIAAIVLTLVCLGLVMIYSSSHVMAQNRFGDSALFLKRQLLRAVLGIMLMALAAAIDYRILRRFALPGLVVCCFLLAILHLGAGSSTRGATRWLRLAHLTLQPSEVARLGLVIFLAAWAAGKAGGLVEFRRGFVPAVLAVLAVCGLVASQPNFGTAACLALIAGLVLYLCRARVVHLLALTSIIGVGAVLAIRSVPHVARRWALFVDPNLDPRGEGWQLAQSKITLGSGWIVGAGPGEGRAKLEFLPDIHTDFIFANLGEEFGFLGALGVLLLILLLTLRGLRISSRAGDAFGCYLAGGISLMFFVTAFLHVAVVTGLFPVTGLPFPFVSYGGSALVVNLVAAGILLNIARSSPTVNSSRSKWGGGR